MTEHGEQTVLFQWARWLEQRYPELELLHAIPNGAKLPYTGKGKQRHAPQALRLKDEGLKAGVPDTFLPVARKGYHGAYCELKEKPNKPSPMQIKWLDRLKGEGYLTCVAYGAQDAINFYADYLDIPKEDRWI